VNGLLEEFGRKIAERWLSTLLLPGLLWVGTAVLTWPLGWRHALDPRAVESVARRFDLTGDHTTGPAVAAATAILIAATGVGMAGVGLAAVIRRFLPAPGRHAPARWLRIRRLRRWQRADLQVRRLAEDALRAATGPAVATGPELAGALARRDAVSLEVPANATWIGDRLRANVHRIHRAYGLDLTLAWPACGRSCRSHCVPTSPRRKRPMRRPAARRSRSWLASGMCCRPRIGRGRSRSTPGAWMCRCPSGGGSPWRRWSMPTRGSRRRCGGGSRRSGRRGR
jgi:hypothetical protein